MTLSKLALTILAATSLIALTPISSYADDEKYEDFEGYEEDYAPPPSMAQVIMRGVADGLNSSIAPSPRDKAWADAPGAASGLPADFGKTGKSPSVALASKLSKAVVAKKGRCFTTLAHLDSKLPRFNLRDLTQVREAVLSEDLTQALARAKAQGLTSHGAAQEALKYANQLESQQAQNRQCIHQTRMNPTKAIRDIEDGNYTFSSTSLAELDHMEACLANYANFRYGLAGAKEAAIGIACLAAAGE